MRGFFADYHTHTVYSHGKGTIEDNVRVAAKLGLKRLAITDHGPGHPIFGVDGNKLDMMRQQIDLMSDKYNIEVLLGIEANITGYDGKTDIDEKYLKKFDIILLGYHSVVNPDSFQDFYKIYIANGLKRILPVNKEKIKIENTKAIIKAIKRYPIDIITHPGVKFDLDIDMLSEAIEGSDTSLEINSSHGYLTVEQVSAAKSYDVKFVINSDAHSPNRVGDFNNAIRTVEEAGLSLDRIINYDSTR